MGIKLLEEFDNIFSQIRNEAFRDVVKEIAYECPDYIIMTPASSSGKYHPQDEVNRPIKLMALL